MIIICIIFLLGVFCNKVVREICNIEYLRASSPSILDRDLSGDPIIYILLIVCIISIIIYVTNSDSSFGSGARLWESYFFFNKI